MTVREMFEDGQLIEDLEKFYGLRSEKWRLSDIKILYKLVNNGQLYALDCDHCQARIIRAYPDNWQDFQGCSSDNGLGELCENCTGLYLSLKQAAGE